ncbi:MAG: hypothetical protein AAF317_10605 [Pseudomonadota bacterium]
MSIVADHNLRYKFVQQNPWVMLSRQHIAGYGKAAIIAVGVALAGSASARDLSAGFVVREMDPALRYPFISGIVEGIAYARFVAEGRSETPGMACIYQWFYEAEGTAETIYAAFERFPDYLPGAVIGALIERRCGA